MNKNLLSQRLRTISIDLLLVIVFLTLMGIALSQLYKSLLGNSLSRTMNEQTVGLVKSYQNDVRIKEQGDYRWYQVGESLALEEGDEIFTGAESQVEIEVGNQSISLGAYTLAKVNTRSNSPEINLEFGEIEVDVSQPIVLASKGKRLNLRGDQSKARVKLKVGKKKSQLSVVSGQLKLAKNKKLVSKSVEVDKSPLAVGKAIDLDKIELIDTSLESFSDPFVGDITEEIREEIIGPTVHDKSLAAIDRTRELTAVEFEILDKPELNLNRLELEVSEKQMKEKGKFIEAGEDQDLVAKSLNVEMGDRVFDFQVSTEPSFKDVLSQRRLRKNSVAFEKFPKKDFYVRVRYFDLSNRDWSEYSEVRKVDVKVEKPDRGAASIPPVGGLIPVAPMGPPAPPKPMFLSSPKLKGLSDGETFIANKKFPVVMRLNWDPNSYKPGASLEFEVSKTPDFSKVIEKTTTDQKRLLFSNRLKPGTYYWRARVINGDESSQWSRPKKVIIKAIQWKGSHLPNIRYNYIC